MKKKIIGFLAAALLFLPVYSHAGQVAPLSQVAPFIEGGIGYAQDFVGSAGIGLITEYGWGVMANVWENESLRGGIEVISIQPLYRGKTPYSSVGFGVARDAHRTHSMGHLGIVLPWYGKGKFLEGKVILEDAKKPVWTIGLGFAF